MLLVHKANCIIGYMTEAWSTHLPKQRIINAAKDPNSYV